jgi:hypothetical protein
MEHKNQYTNKYKNTEIRKTRETQMSLNRG